VPAISLSGVTKRYTSDDGLTTLANQDVDLSVEPRALHAIVGENGAGKSTLVHILTGRVSPDTGNASIFGAPLELGDVSASKQLGMGLVAQYFTLVGPLTVWENVVLGNEPSVAGLIDRDAARQLASDLASSLDLDISPDDIVEDLPMASRQGVEIMKAMRDDTRILILDEPTSVLGPQESKRLFERIASLRDNGTTVVLVTHHMREVLEHATDVTVLRHGKSVANFERDDFDENAIVEAIVGRQPRQTTNTTVGTTQTGIALQLENVSLRQGDLAILDNLSLNVARGEIVGLAGVAGNGQTELASLVAGHTDPTAGHIHLSGSDATDSTPCDRRDAGLAYIPEDRAKAALVGSFSVRDNLLLGGHHRYGSPWRLDQDAADTFASELITRYDIRTPSQAVVVDSLSGGNQQKVVIARELSRSPNLVVAMYPTQGLDLGASAFVHEQLAEACAKGCGVLLVSNDLEELRTMCNRIAVIYRGRIAGIMDTSEYDEQQIGSWMTTGDA